MYQRWWIKMDLKNKSVLELKELIATKQISVTELVTYYLGQIERYKDKNAVLEVFDDAITEAKKWDEIIASGKTELPKLAGIPIIIKDNILYKGKKCTCASLFMKDYVAQYDATVIKKLLAEGVIILGRANMDEFAMGGSTERSAYGPCKNAWNDTKVPGGSSGGSAVAVALDMCAFSLGSDTGGSVRQPSAYNGTYGIKPTYSRVSRYGLVAFASSLDQIGPITKTVADNAYVLGIIAGHDINDATSGKNEVPDYLETIENDISGVKVGIIKEVQDLISTTEYAGLYRDIETWFAEHNAVVGEVSIKDYQLALPVYYTVAPAEATSNLGRFDGVKYTTRSEDAKEIDEVYCLSRTEGFGPEVKRRIMLGNFVLSSGYYDAYYKKAKKIQQMLKKQFAKAFEECDVIIMPTAFGEAFDLNSKTNDPVSMYVEDMFTISANIVGVPAMSIPCGRGKNGLPLGLQILAKEWNEKIIYQVARYFEKMHKEDK